MNGRHVGPGSSRNYLGLGRAGGSGTALLHAGTPVHSVQLQWTERRRGLPCSSRGVCSGRSLRDQIFFLLRTALKDRPKGPPTANRQLPPTANRQQPSTANRQPRPTANCQPLPTATNHPVPTANCPQPPPTVANHQPPTANRQSPPAANCQSPPTMVEHMSYTRSFLKKPCSGTVFFSPVKDRPGCAPTAFFARVLFSRFSSGASFLCLWASGSAALPEAVPENRGERDADLFARPWHCRKAPCAVFEHAFVWTLHLTRSSAVRPPLAVSCLSRQPRVRVCVRVCA